MFRSIAATAITVVATSVRNMVFTRNALVLAARLPSLPADGDIAIDRQTIVDPRSGMSFEIAIYPQYRQIQYEISAAWGVAVAKAEQIAAQTGREILPIVADLTKAEARLGVLAAQLRQAEAQLATARLDATAALLGPVIRARAARCWSIACNWKAKARGLLSSACRMSTAVTRPWP